MPTAAFPARCAVSVVCGEKLVSQVYPAAVPVEVFVDDAIELLDDDLRRRGAPGLDPSVRYEFQRTNGTRLDITKSLAELGIDDGATLLLYPEGDGDSFEPQLESLSTGLARVGRRLFPPVTAESAVGCATAIAAMTTMTVLGLALSVRCRGDEPLPGLPVLLIGAILAVSAAAVYRWFPENRQLLEGLAWLAVPAAAGGLAMAVPGRLGAAHLFIACVAAAVSIAIVIGFTGSQLALASALGALSLLGTLVSAAHEWLGLTPQRLGILGLLALLVLVTASPSVALRLVRIRPPHFGSITGRDIFTRGDGMPADAVAPVDAESGDDPVVDTTPAAAQVTRAALRVNAVLTGLCVAVAVGLPVSAWFALTPGTPHRGAVPVLIVMSAAVFVSRARAFTDRRQATALVLGASAMLCTVAVRHVIYTESGSSAPYLWSVGGLCAFATAGMTAALLVPVTRFTPLVRTFTEWVELAAIVVALPLAAWITGLFAWVRMR